MLPPGSVTQNSDGTVSVNGAKVPPGSQVKTLPDGSVAIVPAASNQNASIGNVPHPAEAGVAANGTIVLPSSSEVVTSPDGTVFVNGQQLPPGSSVQQQPDGSYVIANPGTQQCSTSQTVPKGTKVVENANGSISVNGQVLPAGSQIQHNDDGSVTIVSPAADNNSIGGLTSAPGPLPQGSVVNSSGVVSLPKDTSIVQSPEGLLIVDGVVMPAGTIVNADGSLTLANNNQQPSDTAPYQAATIQTSQSGIVTIGGVPLPPGSQCSKDSSVLLPKGTKLVHNPDGTVSINGKALPKGTVAVTNPDGSISLKTQLPQQAVTIQVSKSADGSLTLGSTKLPKGSSQNKDGSISLPKVSTVIRNRDGSVTVNGQVLPPGFQVVTNPDGSHSLVQQSSVSSPVGLVNVGNIKLPTGSQQNRDGSISVPAAANIIQNPDGSYLCQGKLLPPGTQVKINKDGSKVIILPSPMGLNSGFVYACTELLYHFFGVGSDHIFDRFIQFCS